MVPAPSGAHASLEWQLAAILRPLAQAVGLEAVGQFNLGEREHDFRVPDGGLHRTSLRGTWFATAALVVEIVSPGDESWEKLPFYAAHRVDEILIVDPQEQTVNWLALEHDQYQSIQHSRLINNGPVVLAEQIDWPAVEPPQEVSAISDAGDGQEGKIETDDPDVSRGHTGFGMSVERR